MPLKQCCAERGISHEKQVNAISHCVSFISRTHSCLVLSCLFTAEAPNAAERLPSRYPWATKVLVEVEDDLQGVATPQVREGRCGFRETN